MSIALQERVRARALRTGYWRTCGWRRFESASCSMASQCTGIGNIVPKLVDTPPVRRVFFFWRRQKVTGSSERSREEGAPVLFVAAV